MVERVPDKNEAEGPIPSARTMEKRKFKNRFVRYGEAELKKRYCMHDLEKTAHSASTPQA